MTDPTAQAREPNVTIEADGRTTVPYEEHLAALLAVEQRVWGACAKHIVENEDDFLHVSHSGGPIPDLLFDVAQFAKWARAQAQQAQGRKKDE